MASMLVEWESISIARRSYVMSKENPKGKSKVEQKTKTKISSADDLIKTSKRADIELDEEELKRVTGGAVEYFHKAT
jgi:hypothetical protein